MKILFLFLLVFLLLSSFAYGISVTSIAVTPLSNNTFVMVYCDDTNDDISFIIYNTNGSNLTGEIDADTSAGDCVHNSVSVSAFNSTAFVIGWYDSVDSDASFSVWNNQGANLTGVIDADTNVGISYSVSVSAFNSTSFVVGWHDGIYGDVLFRTYQINGSPISVEIAVDTTTYESITQVSAFNSTSFVIGWYDGTDTDASFRTYRINGSPISASIDSDTDIGYSDSVSVSAINSTSFVIGWQDETDDDVTAEVDSINGDLITTAFDVDTTTVGDGAVSVSAINSTSFVVGWYDGTDTDASFRTYQINGSPISAQIDASTTALAYVSVAAKSTATNIGFCNNNFVIAWVSNTTNFNWSVYNVNGSAWNGICISPNNAPVWTKSINNVSLNSSLNLSIQFNCTDADNDPLTYGDNTSMWSINSSGYVFDDPDDGADIGNFSIQINCSDGFLFVTMNFTYEVWNGSIYVPPNNAPVWTQTINNISFNSSMNLSIQFNCTDADSDPLTYGDNTSMFAINGSGYVFDDPDDGADIGNWSIQINCSDSSLFVTMNFTYEVWNGSIFIESNETNETPSSGAGGGLVPVPLPSPTPSFWSWLEGFIKQFPLPSFFQYDGSIWSTLGLFIVNKPWIAFLFFVVLYSVIMLKSGGKKHEKNINYN